MTVLALVAFVGPRYTLVEGTSLEATAFEMRLRLSCSSVLLAPAWRSRRRSRVADREISCRPSKIWTIVSSSIFHGFLNNRMHLVSGCRRPAGLVGVAHHEVGGCLMPALAATRSDY